MYNDKILTKHLTNTLLHGIDINFRSAVVTSIETTSIWGLSAIEEVFSY